MAAEQQVCCISTSQCHMERCDIKDGETMTTADHEVDHDINQHVEEASDVASNTSHDYHDSFSVSSGSESSLDAHADTAEVANFIATQGLHSCTAIRLLGTGATCRVELVEVHLPCSGGVLLAARKTIPRHSNSIMRAQCDKLFARELEGLRAGRTCPYFVRRLGDAEYEDRFELLLELASGGTLEGELTEALSRVEGTNQMLLPADRIAELAAGVLTALDTLHQQGYAHLDIKPANLLLTGEGRVLLGDTGCVSRRDAAGLLHSPAGSPLFMAPELKRRGVGFTTAADMYSVGVLLAMCAAWHRQTGRCLNFLRGNLPLPDYVPGPLVDLVARLVCAEPGERLTAEQALAHPFLRGVDVSKLAPVRPDVFSPPR